MKTVTENKTVGTDFYLSNLAPTHHHHETPFRYLDMILLTVLFLEVGGVIRMLIAK
jgi:hypothetical protein